MTGENAKEVIGSVVDGLKGSPMALALLLINILFVGLGGYLFKTAIDRHEAHAARVSALVSDCLKRE